MRHHLAPAWAALLLLACAGIQVETESDPGVDFGALRAWAWLPAPAPVGDLAEAPDARRRIRDALARALEARGYPEVTPAEASFWVATHAAIRHEVETQRLYRSYGRAGWGGGGFAEAVVDEYDQGTLVIDFLRPGSGELIWRGTAEARIDERGDPARLDARVREAIGKILDRFPPGT